MNQKDVLKLAQLTRAHEKEWEPRMAIRRAMKEFGIKDNDPNRDEIFREVAKQVAEERHAEREMAIMKKAIAMQGAAENQARHPEDAYRNL